MENYCIHVANIFYLVSFLNRDMLWLRILTCAGLAFGVVFFTTCPTPMYGPTVWHIVFLFINFYQIYRLILARRETDLSHTKEVVGEVVLEGMNRDELLSLLALEMSGKVDPSVDPQKVKDVELSENEEVLKDLVLDRLSRKELVNLLTRRMWKPFKRRFKRRRKRNEISDPVLEEQAEELTESIIDQAT